MLPRSGTPLRRRVLLLCGESLMSACLGRVTQPPGLRVNDGGRQQAAERCCFSCGSGEKVLEWKETYWSRLQEADAQQKILPSVYYSIQILRCHLSIVTPIFRLKKLFINILRVSVWFLSEYEQKQVHKHYFSICKTLEHINININIEKEKSH